MKSFLLSLCTASFLAITTTAAHADALHGFCYGGATCSDMGSNTPTSVNPPKFGFVSSPSGDTGAFYIDILVPNNVGTLLTGYGVTNTSNSTTSSATLVSPVSWTSGQLDSYLHLAGGANPANPIGAFLPGTQALVPSATGFFVYQDFLGTQTLNGSGPLLTLQSSLPLGAYIVGFLNVGTTANPEFVGTANSGAIFEVSGSTPPPVPEPSSLMLLGSGIAMAAGLVRRRMKALA